MVKSDREPASGLLTAYLAWPSRWLGWPSRLGISARITRITVRLMYGFPSRPCPFSALHVLRCPLTPQIIPISDMQPFRPCHSVSPLDVVQRKSPSTYLLQSKGCIECDGVKREICCHMSTRGAQVVALGASPCMTLLSSYICTPQQGPKRSDPASTPFSTSKCLATHLLPAAQHNLPS